MSCKISAFSFSNNLDSMNTKGLLMMNDHIKFHVCKSMCDYNMKLIDTNDVDGRVDMVGSVSVWLGVACWW